MRFKRGGGGFFRKIFTPDARFKKHVHCPVSLYLICMRWGEPVMIVNRKYSCIKEHVLMVNL